MNTNEHSVATNATMTTDQRAALLIDSVVTRIMVPQVYAVQVRIRQATTTVPSDGVPSARLRRACDRH
ncbi:hypothetical protein MNVM_33540 [Mycobacterium novum]|uniref:Uncharacterized protein n=1 Tax=Mycobacterium novum TaxID=2492438 RepID=A0A7I7JRA9_9MYCO|nr:hypothetical protein MNVM_33540 [Mycobacterium novum]